MLSIPEPGRVKPSPSQTSGEATGSGEKLFSQVKNLRKSLADQANVPPYVIFPDRSLREMTETRPCDLHAFKNINGVGDVKLEKYGSIFVSAIKAFCEESGTGTTSPEIPAAAISGDTLEQ